jgi:hypothetical protein
MTESTIYETMYPFCRGELLSFVTYTITARESFENFHARLLGQFIPSRQNSKLKAEGYERVQFEGEPFATYVQSIRDAALVLRITESEAQVVERIVEVLTLTQRASFVLLTLPSSFLPMDRLAVVDRSVAHADLTRTVQSAAVTVGVVESPPERADPRYSYAKSQRTSRPCKPAVCFHCPKPGHLQKRCFLRLAQLRKSDPPVAKSQP